MADFTIHKCGRRCASLVQVHCPTCCEQFSNPGTFDLHRKIVPRAAGGDGVDRECHDPTVLHRANGDPVFRADGTGPHGTVWRHWADPDGKDDRFLAVADESPAA